jgi:hypothetical protein
MTNSTALPTTKATYLEDVVDATVVAGGPYVSTLPTQKTLAIAFPEGLIYHMTALEATRLIEALERALDHVGHVPEEDTPMNLPLRSVERQL